MPVRRRWLVVWIVATLAVAGVSFGAGSLVESPFSEAASNAAKDPWTTAEVAERKFVASAAHAQGVLSLGGSAQISVPATSSERAVVTAVGVQMGAPVAPGSAVVAVSGRPVLALVLKIPLYRDLAPGMAGPDVASVQQSLKDLGLYDGRVDGEYGRQTSDAVAALYQQAGAESPSKVAFVNATPAPAQIGALQADVPVQPALETPTAETDPVASSGASPTEGGAASPAPVPAASAPSPTPEVPMGVPLPMAEVADIPDDETTVTQVPTKGQILKTEEALVTMRTGRPFVTARVSVADKDAFVPGTQVDLQVVGGSPMTKAVASLSEFRPGTDGGDPAGYDLRVDLEPGDVKGVADQAVVTVDPTAAGAVQNAPAVPFTAVREVEGKTVVVLDDAEGTMVKVQTGLVNDGWVQIVDSPDLPLGTVVRIGGPDRTTAK